MLNGSAEGKTTRHAAFHLRGLGELRRKGCLPRGAVVGCLKLRRFNRQFTDRQVAHLKARRGQRERPKLTRLVIEFQ